MDSPSPPDAAPEVLPPPVERPALPQPSVLAYLGALLVLNLLPALTAPRADAAARLCWSEVFGLAALSAIAATGANLSPAPLLRLRAPRPALLGLGALAGAAGFVVAQAAAVGWVSLLPPHLTAQFDVAHYFAQPRWARFAFAAAATIVAPLCEELAFRGYLLSALSARWGPGAGIGLSALLFAAIHLDPVRFPAVLVLGLLFGLLAWRTGSVWPSALAHAVNNGIVSALALTAGGGSLAEAQPTAEELRSALALGALGLSALAVLLAGLRRLSRPPRAADALRLRDPQDAARGFRLARVPSTLALAVPAGLATLALLALGGR